MKSSPGPVVFFPRNPVMASIAIGFAVLVLKTPKFIQSAVLAAIRSIRS